MSEFKVGDCYSRVEINKALHGGGLQNSLLHKNNRILAGCFKRSLNPDLPDTVLIRSGEKRDSYQDLLKTSKDFKTKIPLFVNNEIEFDLDGKHWEYQGEFICESVETEAREIITYLKNKNMSEEAGDIVAVVHFKKVEFIPAYIIRKKAA